jgi:cellulose synthase/poly-beta-1,6-N-acetylglucosamine synthase-like glycosyltransferase
MELIFEVLFWSCFLGIAYAYIGYPLLLFGFSSLALSKAERASSETELASSETERNVPDVSPREGGTGSLPTVTVVIAAFNAERQIRGRIQNLLECDYPPEKLQIIVASDGSTDQTAAVVREFESKNVIVLEFPERRGKVATLADAVSHASGDVLLFTDASIRFDRNSVATIARNFTDPDVGVVSGKVEIVDDQGKPLESLYWRSEFLIRKTEARLGIMLGASGAIYAIRRSLFIVPSRPVINDDLILPMLVNLTHGCQFVFDETAKATVANTGGFLGEFTRRVRIGSGAFQSIPELVPLLFKKSRKHAVAFFSHKVLRWICPFLLIGMTISNCLLLGSLSYRMLFCGQLLMYTVALAGMFIPNYGTATTIPRTAASFTLMNAALFFGFFRWLLKPNLATWNPTHRPDWNPSL